MIKKITSVLLCMIVMITCLCVPVSAVGSLPDVPAPYIIFDDWKTGNMYSDGDPATYIRIMNEDFCTIRYTLDGSTPNSSSAKFPSELLGVKYPSNGKGVVKKCLKLLVSKKGYNPKIFTYYFGIHKEYANGITSTPQYVNFTEEEAKLTLDNIIAGYANKVKKKKSALERIVLAAEVVGMSMDYDLPKVHSNFKNASSNKTIQVCSSLTMGCGVCEDDSQVFSTLCTKLGIDCVMVSIPNHGWNMVRYNGKWYNVDVTNGEIMKSDKDYEKGYGDCNGRKIASSYYLNNNPIGLSSAPTSSSSIDEEIIRKIKYTTIPEIVYVDKGALICLDWFMNGADKAQFMSYDKSIAAVVKKSGKYYIKGFKDGDTKIGIKTDEGTEFFTVSVRKRQKSKKFDVNKTELKLKVGEGGDVYAVRDSILIDDDGAEGIFFEPSKQPDIYYSKISDNGYEEFMCFSPSDNICLNGHIIESLSPGKATVYVVGSSGRCKKVTVTVTK